MAQRPTMVALLTLLALFIAGTCAAQTNSATADKTARNGGPWVLIAVDADGGSASHLTFRRYSLGNTP